MELAPGLHRIGSDLVAAYLVVTDDGVTVVDAGLPGMWPDLVAELRALGLAPRDVRGVVLTHGDSDHVGFAERLRREAGTPVYVHEADAARARGEEKGTAHWGPWRPAATLRFLWWSAWRGGLRTRWLTEVTPLHGDETLDLPGAPRVLPLPGHSPGSVALHVPSVDAVFVGDGLTTRDVLTGATGPRPAPFTDDPARALESLRTIEAVGARWVLPGHGPAWGGGTEEAVRRVRAAAPADRPS